MDMSDCFEPLGKAPIESVVQWMQMQQKIEEIYQRKGWVFPDEQDAATFTAQEAHEIIDIFLRRKSYVRNHEKHFEDELWKEIAQCYFMLMVTCFVSDHNLFEDFNKFYEEIVNESTN